MKSNPTSTLPAALANACCVSADPERARTNLQRLLDAAPDRQGMLRCFEQHHWLGKLLAESLACSQTITDTFSLGA